MEKANKKDNEIIPDNASIPRYIDSKHRGSLYSPINSLEEAQTFDDGVIVLEGDFGGVIYLVCPASLVKCNYETLNNLLKYLNKLVWRNQTNGTKVYFERHNVGDVISGGSGGGKVTNGVWLHPSFEKLNIQSKVEEIIKGTINISSLLKFILIY